MIRYIILVASITLSLTAWPDGGGVGGLDGGSKILFQRESILIEPSRNKSLCLNATDTYQANVRVCTQFDNKRDCVGDYVPKTIFQPRVSVKEVCTNKKAFADNGWCPDQYRELKPFVQEPTRILRELDRDGYVIDEKQIRIPDCN